MNKYLVFLLLISIFSCKEKIQKDSFSLSGEINGNYSGFIYLNYGKTKDSVKVINHKFEFKGTVKKPTQGRLHLEHRSKVTWIYIENSAIKIQIDFEKKTQNKEFLNFLKIIEITGSKSAEFQKEYQSFFQANKSKQNFKDLLYNKLEKFVKENAKHPFTGTILGELALIQPILSRSELINLHKLIDTTNQNKEDLKMFKIGINNMNNYGIGDLFPQFELQNPSSKKISIREYLGKITLVDFWASWCAPCREKHPDLIRLKKQFKDKSFDILSISIDKNKEDWKNAIRKDQLTWNNVLDENKKINDQLGISGIPFNYLINEKGIIIGVNVSIGYLKNSLSKKFNSP